MILTDGFKLSHHVHLFFFHNSWKPMQNINIFKKIFKYTLYLIVFF